MDDPPQQEIAKVSREIEAVGEKIRSEVPLAMDDPLQQEVSRETVKVTREIEAVDEKIEAVDGKIEAVDGKIEAVDEKIRSEIASESPLLQYWIRKEEQLRKEKEQLRTEKEQLRTEKEQLRKEKEQLRKEKEQLQKEKELLLLKSSGVSHRRQGAADEFAALAAAVPEFSWNSEDGPSEEALEKYLLDFDCLAGRVPLMNGTYFEQLSGPESKAFFRSNSELASFVLSAIITPMTGSGEYVANSHIFQFCRLLDCMRRCSSIGFRLDFQFSMDRVEAASGSTSTQTTRLGKRKRPDFLLEVREFLFMLGEGKDKESDFSVACNEIRMKLATVPGWVFGDVRFFLAFAAAGFRWQLFLKRGSSEEPEAVGKAFDLKNFDDRVKLVLLFFKLYFVCLSMTNKHVHTGMLPLFKKHERAFATVELDAEGCVKVIEKWSEFKRTFGVAFLDIEKAYSVSAAQLVFAVVPPVVSKGRYSVRTGPLGLPAKFQVRSVDDCKQLARDLLTALAALHAVELVHRDIRLANVIWSPDKKCYVLIDLECVGRTGSRMSKVLTDYTSDTLVDRKYTKTSDLYQLGVLLTKLILLLRPDEQCKDFIRMLQSHGSNCKPQKLLTHAWLA